MPPIALEGLGLLAVFLCIVFTICLLLRRHHNAAVKMACVAVEGQKPLVRLLDEREDLEVAVRRAAEFERRMAAMLEARARRYESLLARPATITQIPTDKRARTEAVPADEPDSA
jgi:hypothetical protein